MELSLGVPGLWERIERAGGPAWGSGDLSVPGGEGA